MLALPIVTGLAGFYPALFILLLCWTLMTLSGLALLEVSLWMDENDHYISMSEKLLGTWGKVVSWVLYLFIGYASLVAYTAGGGEQFGLTVEFLTGQPLSKLVNCACFLGIFGAAIAISAKIVGKLNSILFVGMVASYCGLVLIGLPQVHPTYLGHVDWSYLPLTVPLLLTSFSYQAVVPSLRPLLKNHGPSLRWALLLGTTITLVIYLIWLVLILGIIPLEGEYGLRHAFQNDQLATLYLEKYVGDSFVAPMAKFFSFFALVTSFLGIGMGLFDFLSDGLKIPKNRWGTVKLLSLMGFPILYCAVYLERAFFSALDSSGGYGDTILSGFIPLSMLWVGLYHRGWRIQGGVFPWNRPIILLLIGCFLSGLLLEIAMHTGLVTV